MADFLQPLATRIRLAKRPGHGDSSAANPPVSPQRTVSGMEEGRMLHDGADRPPAGGDACPVQSSDRRAPGDDSLPNKNLATLQLVLIPFGALAHIDHADAQSGAALSQA